MGFMRPHAVRFMALIFAGLLVAPAIAECAGWALSEAGRHVCCANRGEMASETSMTDCCGISQQSNDAVPPDTQEGRVSFKLLGSPFAQFADLLLSWRSPFFNESSFAPRLTSFVPLYLRQGSLLI